MKYLLSLIVIYSSTVLADPNSFSCVDLQSIAVEKSCYNPSPGTPDYVYPFRKCYTKVELTIDSYPDPSDFGIRELTTKVREAEVVRLMGLGKLAFDLPEACLPK